MHFYTFLGSQTGVEQGACARTGELKPNRMNLTSRLLTLSRSTVSTYALW